MVSRLFGPSFDELPRVIPVFPLAGALLLPHCRLPLNIFEPRYLRMTLDALANERLIGMVQPRDPELAGAEPEMFTTGCAGRISSFSETDDGRFLIVLTGMCRFDIVEELDVPTPYRQVVANWDPYRADMHQETDGEIGRDRLYTALRAYFDARDLDTDWEVLESASDEHLINSLAMSCPFSHDEKQALLEADDLLARYSMMLSLLEMATLEHVSDDMPLH